MPEVGASLVLLSGGIDSAALVAFYRPASVLPLFVDYGQAAAGPEHTAAQSIAEYYGLDLQIVSLSGADFARGPGEILGRNLLLVGIAAASAHTGVSRIAMGVHTGTPYFDCSPSFTATVSGILEGYTSGAIGFSAPFVEWEKSAIVEFARQADVPFNLTYSCERGTIPVCQRCRSCLDRKELGVS